MIIIMHEFQNVKISVQVIFNTQKLILKPIKQKKL